jgi:hypothetical protein
MHAKFGQVCELDPGHVSNQIGQQQKNAMKIRNVYLRNFAELFREIKKIDFRIHPTFQRQIAKKDMLHAVQFAI